MRRNESATTAAGVPAAAESDPRSSTWTLGGDGPAVRTAPPAAAPYLFTRGELVAERFRVLGPRGRGGRGQVFEAYDLLLGHRVALKAIRPELAGRPESMDHLRSEVLLAREVTHPNVCRIFDVFRHVVDPRSDPPTETLVMAMELLDGETLARRLRRDGPLPAREAGVVLRQLTAALAAAHRAGVLHLDFKSANVVLTRREGRLRAVVTDFGLAARTAPDRGEPGTATGGTLGYMAPEQRAGETVAPASDVYALGCVVHEVFTGTLPAGSAGGRTAPAPLPRPWRTLVGRCLQPAPEARPRDAGELQELLSRATGRRGRRRAVRRAVATTAGLAVLMLLGPVEPAPDPASRNVASAGAERPRDPLRTVPGDPEVRDLYLRARDALRALDGRAARADLARVVAREPRFALGHEALSRASSHLGLETEARARAEHAATLGAEGDRETRLLLEARLAETGLDWSAAADRYRALRALFGDNPWYAARLIAAEVEAGRADEAERVASELREAGHAASLGARLPLLEARIGRRFGDARRQLLWAERAVAAGGAAGAPGIVGEARLLEAEAFRELGETDRGLAASEAALELFDGLDNGRGRLRALVQLAELHADLGHPREGVRDLLRRASETAGGLDSPRAEAVVLASRGGLSWQEGDLERARERFTAVRELHRSAGDRSGVADAEGSLALVSLTADDLDRAAEHFDAALRIRRAIGPPTEAAILLNNVAILYTRRGEPRRARDAWEESGRLAREGGNALLATITSINLAEIAIRGGDLARAARVVREEVEPALEAVATPGVSARAALLAGSIAFLRDRQPEALRRTAEALSLAEGSGHAPSAARARMQLAGIHNAAGRFAEAEPLARAATETFVEAGAADLSAVARYRLFEAVAGLGRMAEAADIAHEMAGRGAGENLHRVALLALARSRLRLAAGDPAGARAILDAALDELPARSLEPWRFEVRLALAETEAALGAPDRGRGTLREIAEDARRSRFSYFARRATELLASSPTSPVRR